VIRKTLLLFSFILVMLVTSTLPAQQSVKENAEKLFRNIDNNKDNHLFFLKQLIAAQKEGEEVIQGLVAEKFRKLGCKVETLKMLPANLSMKHQFAAQGRIPSVKRISVVGTFHSPDPGRSLLLFAHPDGVDITNTKAWTHDPFAGETDANRIYGWGVADDLAGVAAMAEALEALLKSGLKPRGDVYLCSTPAKKNAQGVTVLLGKGYSADAAVYLHPAESGAGMKEIKAIASGMLQFIVKVPGKKPPTTEPGKTAFAHLGINAIDKAMILIQSLKVLNKQRNERIYHEKIHEAVGRSTNLLVGFINAGNETGLTQVPEQCTFGASLTFPPGEKLPEVQQEIQDCIATASRKDEWLQTNHPEIEWIFGTQGVEVRVEHPLYQTVSNAIKSVTHKEPYVNPLHSASDIRNPILFSDIPTVGYGPLSGNLSQNGEHDEWVDIQDFIRSVKVTALTILEWCK